jgi:hypothetical protein
VQVKVQPANCHSSWAQGCPLPTVSHVGSAAVVRKNNLNKKTLSFNINVYSNLKTRELDFNEEEPNRNEIF